MLGCINTVPLSKENFQQLEGQLFDALIEIKSMYTNNSSQLKWIDNLSKYWRMELIQMSYVFNIENDLNQLNEMLLHDENCKFDMIEYCYATSLLLGELIDDVQSIKNHFEPLFGNEKIDLLKNLYAIKSCLHGHHLLGIEMQFDEFFQSSNLDDSMATIEMLSKILHHVNSLTYNVNDIRYTAIYRPWTDEITRENNKKAADAYLHNIAIKIDQIKHLIYVCKESANSAALNERLLGSDVNFILNEFLGNNIELNNSNNVEHIRMTKMIRDTINRTSFQWLKKWQFVWQNIGIRMSTVASIKNRFKLARESFQLLKTMAFNRSELGTSLGIYNQVIMYLDVILSLLNRDNIGFSKNLIQSQRKLFIFINNYGIREEHSNEINWLFDYMYKTEMKHHPNVIMKLNNINKDMNHLFSLLGDIHAAENNKFAMDTLIEVKSMFEQIYSSISDCIWITQTKLNPEEEEKFNAINLLVISFEFDN